jgi:surface protein
MRKIISGRRGSGRGKFEMIVNTAITTQYGSQPPSATNQFYFPIANGTDRLGYTISFTIDWGDSTTSNVNSINYATACFHTYSSPGTYTISAEGSIAGFNFWNSGTSGKADGNKLLEITRWGDLKITGGAATSVGQTFRQCGSLGLISAPDTPWFPGHSNGIDLNTMGGRATFGLCNSLAVINNIANWDVSKLKIMEIMFQGCGKWQYGTNASGPIDISNWDASRSTDFERMFSGCSLFNSKMFNNVGANTAGLPNSFNVDMRQMFSDCTVFNNQNSGTMNSWDTSGVTKMDYMFDGCIAFNDNITSWNTSLVTTMRQMFNRATIFNQAISGWNTANVVDMRDMFTNATAFNQPIGNWNVNAWSQVGIGNTPLTGPSTTFTLSTANYDALLLAWDAAYSFPSWPGGVVDFGNSQYSLTSPGNAVALARASLVNKWGTLNDGGGI